MFRPARASKLLVLGVVFLLAFAAVIAVGDRCDDDHSCAPSCGDCVACGVVAYLGATGTLALTTAAAPDGAGPQVQPIVRPPRAIEHVPLLQG